MKRFEVIITVIEPRQLNQPALDRALSFYHYMHRHAQETGRDVGCRLIAVMPVNEFTWDLTSILSVEQEDKMQLSVQEKYQNWLEAFLKIHAMGIEIEPLVMWSKTIGKDLTALAKERGADLIIKTADVHGMLDQVVFTPLDWQLLRHSPVPVLIAKDHMWSPTGTIVVAVDLADPENTKKRLSAIRMLREAQKLSRFTHCTIHLGFAIPPLLPPAVADMSAFTNDTLTEEHIKNALSCALAFAHRHNIPPEYCHIREGQPDEVIPQLCQELQPTALFIGTQARKGLWSAIVGNICEKVVDSLDCDIAVITPKSVYSRVPTSLPTKL
ncbi:MAG: universal stress protein [Succinivibrio sp.]|nr:universal stress protein [Succinivibrio sp.]